MLKKEGGRNKTATYLIIQHVQLFNLLLQNKQHVKLFSMLKYSTVNRVITVDVVAFDESGGNVDGNLRGKLPISNSKRLPRNCKTFQTPRATPDPS